jgi:hypothetical protein
LSASGDAEQANEVMNAAPAIDKHGIAAVRRAAGPSKETS